MDGISGNDDLRDGVFSSVRRSQDMLKHVLFSMDWLPGMLSVPGFSHENDQGFTTTRYQSFPGEWQGCPAGRHPQSAAGI